MTAPRQQTEALRYALEYVPDIKPARSESPPVASRDGQVPLEAVLCTEELSRRPTRPPDYEAENRAMAILLQALADSPPTLLQTLADTLLEVFQADSAGISLLARDEKSFVWTAVAGAWQAHTGGGTLRDFGPCGDVFDGKVALLFKHFERRYPGLLAVTPLAEECLVLPFYVQGKAVGTIWLMAHDTRRKFDAEDLRQLENFGRFAAAAYRATALLDAAIEQGRAAIGLREEAVQARQAMEKLRESEEHYRARFESLDEGFCIIEKIEGETLDFCYVEVNPAFAVQTSLNGVLGKTLRQVLPDEFEERLRIYDAVSKTGEPIKFERVFGSQGRVLELYAFRVADEAHRRVAINFRDITERKQAEEKLAQQAAELASLYATAPVGLFMLDSDLRYVRINRAMAELNGLPAEQHIGRALRDLLMAKLADDVEPLLRQVLETGQPVLNHEVQGATVPRPGEPRYWLASYHPVLAGDGTVRGVHGAVQDITRRKLAEQALRESKHFLRSCVDALPGHIAVLDESGTILEINEAWRQFAIENQAVEARVGVGINYLQHCEQALAPCGEAPVYVAGIKDVIAGRRTRFVMEYPCHSPTEPRWFVMQVSRFHNPGPVRVIIVHDDCTERKLAEYASHENEERYRKLFNSMDEGFCIIDMIFDGHGKPVDYRFMEVNPALERQTGMLAATGKRMRELIPDIEEHWFEMYGQVALTGESIRFTNKVKAMDDRWFDVYALRLGGTESSRVAVIFNNITERKKAEEALRQSEERLRLAAEAAHFGMYDRDLGGAYFHISAPIKQMLGYASDAPLDHPLVMSHFHPDDRPAGRVAFQRACDPTGDGHIVVEQRIVRRDGVVRWIASVGRVLFEDGAPRRSIGFWVDITERRRLEFQTQEQAQVMADLARRKDEFLAMLSHELRNPLAPLASAVQVLRLQGSEAPLQQQAIQVIERQVGQLKHLVDDLLEISRINSGSVRLRQERVSVSDIVERALETVRPLIVQHRHEFTVSLPPQPVWLHADATRLEQVLVNLLINAAKYTDEGGRIWLSVEQEDAAEVVLKVRDTGIGIAPELLPHVFDLFTQAERSIDRSQGGLGIGLSLVQRMVELHAGTVKVHSVVGQGSEFVVRLPVMQTAMPPATSPPFVEPAQPPGKACRVLAVDDNVDAVQSLGVLLKMSGHEVQLAYDGPSALDAALAMRPDVVLLDIGLPGLTGYEVAQQLRQQAGFRDTVLVALTGYGRETDRQRSREAGFDYHLVKPANFHEVEQILALVGKPAA